MAGEKYFDRRMKKMFKALRCYIFAFLACATVISVFACSPAKDNDFLEDRAAILTLEEKERITRVNKLLLKELDIHFKLLILDKKVDDINSLAVELFDNLGTKTRGAKGLLFLVDPLGKQVRIEVGYDLEAIFPDIFVGYLEREQMAPFFQMGRVGAGIEATSELFVSRVENASQGKEFDPSAELGQLSNYSGGGGARLDVGMNSGNLDKTPISGASNYGAQDSPEKTLQVYKRVLQNHVKDPNLSLFTPQTRKFFSTWVVTNGQQDNELLTLQKATPDSVIVSGSYAVIRFPAHNRTQAPYFLQKGDKGWMLDFSTMSKVLRMNHRNMWMFKSLDHPFMFGFSDWTFDKNGFPIVKKQQ
ncbi:MAG: TPM domain-containing protein [Desulforhopalus sp.]